MRPRGVAAMISALGLALLAYVIVHAPPPRLVAASSRPAWHDIASAMPPPPPEPASASSAACSPPPPLAGGCLPSNYSDALVSLEFVALPGAFLSIGLDMVSDKPCWAHAARLSVANGPPPPNALFRLEPLAAGAGVALRSLSSGRLLRANPPGGDGPAWVVEAAAVEADPAASAGLRWRLEVGQPIADVVCPVHLLSVATGGHINLPATADDRRTPLSDVRTHRAGGGGPAPQYALSALRLEILGAESAARARRLVARSRALTAEAARAAAVPASSALAAAARRGGSATRLSAVEGGALAIATPVTSKGTRMAAVGDSPYFGVLLRSVAATWAGPASLWNYSFYVGVDEGDPIYDAPGGAAAFRARFAAAVGPRVPLRYQTFPGLRGKPSQVVAELMALAYADGAEWLFQLNDDACLQSRGWEAALATALATNAVFPNLGATGPTDTNNARIFTHAFVHRTHLDIHGRFFPRAFANWYSDDWISAVYGASSTFKLGGVKMRHQVEAQKTAGPERYAIDHDAQRILLAEVSRGLLRAQRWLTERHASLPLPDMCGYVPLVEQALTELEGVE